MAEQIQELPKKGAIQPGKKREDQFLSDIFLTTKPDGSNRFILKKLNKSEKIK